MQETDKKRPYHSSIRQEQARATRRKIIDTARHLFAEDGYAATTLSTIAHQAGVSVPTVTALFSTKFGLLNELIKSAVRGDEAPAPLAIRPWWQEMVREPGPVRQVKLYAENALRIHERTTDIFEIVRGAATADPEIATLRQGLNASRLQDVREVAVSLGERNALRPGMTVEQATDLLWAMGSAEMYRMLVVDRGWPPEQYEQWLASALIHSLLDQPVP